MAWGRSKSAQTPAWNQDDYHTAFTGKLKEQIEQGVAPWQKPWQPGEERLPKNIQTDKPYLGGNSIYLSVTPTANAGRNRQRRWSTKRQPHGPGPSALPRLGRRPLARVALLSARTARDRSTTSAWTGAIPCSRSRSTKNSYGRCAVRPCSPSMFPRLGSSRLPKTSRFEAACEFGRHNEPLGIHPDVQLPPIPAFL